MSLEGLLFGTDDERRIDELVAEFVGEHLGGRVAGRRFRTVSVGVVLGLHLEDGRDVVVKVHQGRWSQGFLLAVGRAQRAAVTAGLPAPQPLLGPAPLGHGLATVETHLDDPGAPTAPGPAHRAVSAAGLAAQVEACRAVEGTVGLCEHPLRLPAGQLWPEPHSPLFDFDATARGAERIDEVATAARALRDGDGAPPVAAHTDWAARNVRFDEQQVLAIYDWDSLALVPESTALGTAAATWSATGEPSGPGAPGPDEIAAYVVDYERARGEPLSDDARRSAGGAALFALAYTARCEHALVVGGRGKSHHRRGLDALDGSIALLDLPALLDRPGR